ncbi:hypothetical protein DW075_16745 [Bacteroides xylanisolvens]|uniref:Uncharacterized protein n=1 Tax=Bacteroides xylanisolvens TaxID=371601 RepID=A0A415FKA8_9BACE|nr:hypothetical protein GFH35_15250 [Bacteroides xylanisolvens]RHK23315.1 hypothetical protein DW075_16745 [Bacteroides xylanisolvens]
MSKIKETNNFLNLSLGLYQSIRFSVSKRLFLGEKRAVGFKGNYRIVTGWIPVVYKVVLSIRNT